MPNGVQTGAARPHGEPQLARQPVGDRENRGELQSWWRNFRHRTAKREGEKSQERPVGIFGIALQDSIRYANVAISLYDAEGNSYIYGYVPIVVAKCGVFLKEKATEVEGIFRLSGSEKRIKELKIAFDSPDRYGKGLNWEGYTVHDAANILRRYFNMLPEPIVPLDFYERFRDPLRGHQEQAVGAIDGQEASSGDFDLDDAISKYQALITGLPPLNRQLLLYVLDLLAVFASKSDINKMTTPNLSAIFQPGTLSHPKHDMSPNEYRLSQDVLIFLIENQDHFLIGMQGTEADAKTVQEVESGPPTPQSNTPTTPGRSKTLLGRSGSTSSAGADSIRKFGGIRRNVSVSSRHSRNSSTVSPITPLQAQPTPTSGIGVHRSNTVPSNRSPAIGTTRFGHPRGSGPSTPPTSGSTPPAVREAAAPIPDEPQVITPSPEFVTPMATPKVTIPGPILEYQPNQVASSNQHATTSPDTPAADSQATAETPTTIESEKKKFNFSGLLGEPRDHGRKPNKLQKRRQPSSNNPSAQSSATSLTGPAAAADEPTSSVPAAVGTTPEKVHHLPLPEGTPQRSDTSTTLKPTVSPAHSFRSHSTATDADPSASEAEGDRTDDRGLPGLPEGANQEKPEKKRRWHFKSRDNILAPRDTPAAAAATAATPAAVAQASRENTMSTLGSNSAADKSHTSFSDAGEPRRSFQEGSDLEGPPPIGEMRERKGSGPVSWFKGKLEERKERKEEKARAKSPPAEPRRGEAQPGSMLSLNNSPPRDQQQQQPPQTVAMRGRSMDVERQDVVTPTPQSQAKAQEPLPQGRPNEVTLQAMGPDVPVRQTTAQQVQESAAPAPQQLQQQQQEQPPQQQQQEQQEQQALAAAST